MAKNMKKLRYARGAIKELSKRSIKRIDPIGTGVGVVAGLAIDDRGTRFYKRSQRKAFKCGQKYKVGPEDSHGERMKKLRQFNKCRREK